VNKLTTQVRRLRNTPDDATTHRFRTIVLLDDFSASGSSYYMPKVDGTVGGKIAKFFNSVMDRTRRACRTCVTPAISTFTSYSTSPPSRRWPTLQEYSGKLWGAKNVDCSVRAVQHLPIGH